MKRHLYAALWSAVLVLGVAVSSAGAQPALPGPSPVAAVPGGGIVQPTAPIMPSSGSAFVSSGPVVVDDNYRLGTGDKMKITVYGEEDMTGEYLVDGSGQVQFPLIGQVNASGKTVHEFIAELTAQLSAKYLRNPRVSLQIENYRPFYIMGEVNKPGEFPYETNLSVLSAIAVAGGYTYRANDSNVFIRRNGSDKEEKLPATGATRIYPGDVVRVAERIF